MPQFSDTGLNSCQYPLKYMFEIVFFADEKQTSTDVVSFSAIRAPISKTASFASLSLNINLAVYMNLQHHIERNEYPDVLVKCWLVKNQDIHGERYPPKVEDVFEKNYKCLVVNALERADLRAPYLIVNLILANPLLLYLQGTNGFNKILNDMTSLEAIQEYEKWLKEKFGDTAFQFTHIGEQYELNKFKYEQILTRNATDLMLPIILINSYKTWNTFGYWFFDDFRFDTEAKADITGYLINLGNINEFPIIDVYQYGDFAMGLKLDNEAPLHDPFGALYQKNPSVITKNYDMQFGFRKATGNRDVPHINVQRQSGKHGSMLGTSIIKSQYSLKGQEPTEETMIYAPDEHTTGLNRFDKTSIQLRDEMKAIETYFLRDTSIDYLQFGKRYNIDPFDLNEYIYIPITICNTFVRDTGMMPVLVHHAKFQMIRYKNSKESIKKSENQY